MILSTLVITSAAASALLGACLGWVSSTVLSPTRGALLVLTGAVLLIFGITGWYPELNRETSKGWVHDGWVDWSLKTGTELGVGATTRLGSPLWFIVPIAAFATGSALFGAGIYAVYGFARSSLSVLLGLAGVQGERLLALGRASQALGRFFAAALSVAIIAMGV